MTKPLAGGATVVDLGVNHGRFAMSIIKQFGCRVVGVEPMPDLFANLPQHHLLTVDEAAITSGANTVDLYVGPNICASTQPTLMAHSTIQVAVAGCTLTALLSRHAVRRVALLKVDIEGAEFEMFDSMRDDDLLRFDQISVEFHDFLDGSLRPLVAAVSIRLADLGFQRLVFSRGNTDVLFLHPRLRLGRFQTVLALARAKYLRGGMRVARRVVRKRWGLLQRQA